MGDGTNAELVNIADDGEIDPGWRCELKSLALRTKKGEVEITEKNSKSKDEDPYKEFALVSKQSFDEIHKLTGTKLEVNSPQLLKALKNVITYYPGEPLDFTEKFTIESPYVGACPC